jgi:hypothetical protein
MKYLRSSIFTLTIAAMMAYSSQMEGQSKIWALNNIRPSENCWCIIRDSSNIKQKKVYHVEIVCRKKGKPKWDVEKIKPHLAIYKANLEKSVGKSLAKGDVYPEQYDWEFKEWKIKLEEGVAPICSTTIPNCLKEFGSKANSVDSNLFKKARLVLVAESISQKNGCDKYCWYSGRVTKVLKGNEPEFQASKIEFAALSAGNFDRALDTVLYLDWYNNENKKWRWIEDASALQHGKDHH